MYLTENQGEKKKNALFSSEYGSQVTDKFTVFI